MKDATFSLSTIQSTHNEIVERNYDDYKKKKR